MTTPAPNFRAELERLLDLYEALGGNWTPHNYTDTWNDALASTRAALATPPPKPPTVMEILDLSGEIEDAGLGQIDLVRAALERWGHG
jgi:hypothetical protein